MIFTQDKNRNRPMADEWQMNGRCNPICHNLYTCVSSTLISSMADGSYFYFINAISVSVFL